MVHGELEQEAVETVGRHAGPDRFGQHVKGFGGEPARAAHRRERLRSMQRCLGRAPALDDVEVGHESVLHEVRNVGNRGRLAKRPATQPCLAVRPPGCHEQLHSGRSSAARLWND
jgi:hypothetical protein